MPLTGVRRFAKQARSLDQIHPMDSTGRKRPHPDEQRVAAPAQLDTMLT
jgi:hypothetical protein